jgi:hypothetical protein
MPDGYYLRAFNFYQNMNPIYCPIVEVFTTNVALKEDADQMLAILRMVYPEHRINFDLEDCDKILRISGEEIDPSTIIHILSDHGFYCDNL